LLVYGDAESTVPTREALADLKRGSERLARTAPGLAWHEAAVALFIDMAAVAQGLADTEYAQRGHDDLLAAQTQTMAALRELARVIDESWRSGFARQEAVDVAFPDLRGTLPLTVTLRRCEGYAFYGLYPETYLEAARDLPQGCIVIGLRSIGTGLAALVAAASDAWAVVTVRPAGPPFSRSVDAGPELERLVGENQHRSFVIADEGPGLSGSSFGGTADWLEALGVPRGLIIFMPSHDGALGREASERHGKRWAEADRRVRSFDQLFLDPSAAAPLHGWFHDITGGLDRTPEDISGGGWTHGRTEIPTSPSREARKLRLSGENGRFVAKFAGLDGPARAKFDRARALHEAGFCVEPLALRYGFLLETEIDGAPTRDIPMAHVVEYCRFRRDSFPAANGGATLRELRDMAEHNIRQGAPEAARDLRERWNDERLARLELLVEPVHVDGRMHWWEWLRVGERVLKTDAVDHSESHDLIGCQDILWDVAGASVEIAANPSDARTLAEAFTSGSPDREELLELMTVCYVAFQLGWWTFSGTSEGAAQSQRYRELVPALLAAPG
jgi:hypothetical protein